jgi:hypothetical protein
VWLGWLVPMRRFESDNATMSVCATLSRCSHVQEGETSLDGVLRCGG